MTRVIAGSGPARVALIGLALLLGAISLVIGVLATHDASSPRPVPTFGTPLAARPVPSSLNPAPSSVPPSLIIPTSSPDKYAQEVARALWSIDYRSVSRAAAVAQLYGQLSRTLPAGVPVGTTLDDTRKVAMESVAPYVPTTAVWAQLAANTTRSSFVTTGVTVPGSWAQAVANGQIADPGLTARLVTGVQAIVSDINGTTSHISQPQSLLIAMLCPPTTASCQIEVFPPRTG